MRRRATQGIRAPPRLVDRVSLPALACSLVALLAAALAKDDVEDLRRFLARYRAGGIDASVIGRLVPSEEPPPAFPAYERARAKLRAEPTVAAAEVLLEAAVLRLADDPAEELRRHATRQPWVIRRRAIDELREYYLRDEIEDWAASRLSEAGLDADRRRVLVEYLGAAHARSARPVIYEVLLRSLSDPDAAVRGAAAGALAPRLRERDLLRLVRVLYDPEAEVRLQAALALRVAFDRVEEAPDEALRGRTLQLASARLLDEDPHVRVTVAELLEAHPNGLVLPQLVEALEQEEGRAGTPDARLRFRVPVENLLHRLTGRGAPPLAAAEWRRWLATPNGASAIRPEGLPGRTESASGIERSYATYFGREVRSNHVVFVLDFSGSMRRKSGTSEYDAGEGPRLQARRIDLALHEFLEYLKGLDETHYFNLVVFAVGSQALFDQLEPATSENKARARSFAVNLPLGGSTDLFAGIVQGLRCAGLDAGMRAATTADTLYLLSDGIPTAGAVTDPADIARILTKMNEGMGLKINVVDLGARHSAFQKHLKALAWQNGGEYIRP